MTCPIICLCDFVMSRFPSWCRDFPCDFIMYLVVSWFFHVISWFRSYTKRRVPNTLSRCRMSMSFVCCNFVFFLSIACLWYITSSLQIWVLKKFSILRLRCVFFLINSFSHNTNTCGVWYLYNTRIIGCAEYIINTQRSFLCPCYVWLRNFQFPLRFGDLYVYRERTRPPYYYVHVISYFRNSPRDLGERLNVAPCDASLPGA